MGLDIHHSQKRSKRTNELDLLMVYESIQNV